MEEHLQTLLAGGVSFPVAWGHLGSGTELPRAAIYQVSGFRDRLLSGSGLITGRLQVDCYGATHLAAIEASRSVRGVLEGYQGGPVQGVFLDAIRSGFDDDAALVHRVSLTFSITYRD